MTEFRGRSALLATCARPVWAVWLSCAAVGCGPSSQELRLARERDELRHEIIEVRQYNDDLKVRMQLAEARNKILIDLVQGLTSDPEHFQPKPVGEHADAALAALDRDVEGLVKNLRHSRTDLDALQNQRSALEAELTQARHTIEAARSSQVQLDAQVAGLRALLAPMLSVIHGGRINASMQFGQLTLQLQENVLFARGAEQLSPEGKLLLAKVAEGLKTATDQPYRVSGPTDETSQRGQSARQLSAARSLAVVAYLSECGVPAAQLVAATHAQAGGTAASGDRYIQISVLPKFELHPRLRLPTTQELLDTNPTTPPSAAAPQD
ncbi:MAG: OmpA family [Pseudomonadota bacterium]